MSCPVTVHPHHAAIFSSDLDRTAAWWEDIFSFKKMFENVFFLPDYGNARMAWMKAPADNFYIELYDFPGLDTTHGEHYWHEYGTKHVCLYVQDDQWDEMIKHLEDKGCVITVRGEHPPEKLGRPTSCKVVFINDPDNNTVEVQQSFTPGEYGT